MAKDGLTPDLTLKELKVTHSTLEKILLMCDKDDVYYYHIFRTYHVVQEAINNEEKEMAKIREEFNEEWRKVMSERIVKYLPTHEA